MYLKNPSGNIIGVADERVPELLEQGFTRLSPEEIKAQAHIFTPNERGLPVHFACHLPEHDGYGQSQDWLRNALFSKDIYPSRDYNGQPIGFGYSVPYIINSLKSPIKILYSMFESTSFPKDWVPYLERADLVLAPSKFVQKMFRTRNIDSKVIPLGINTHNFKYIDRSDREEQPFTFLHYDAFNLRKGFDLVWKAFQEEFGNDMNVRLVLKTVRSALPFPIVKSQYPNIEVIKEAYDNQQMMEMMKLADCFVFPSRGEGFGFTPLEALATGIPTLVPNGSGMSEYFDPEYFEEIKIADHSRDAIYQHYDVNEVGFMIEPDLEDLKKQMRKVYENYAEAKEKADRGAKWVAENWSIDNTAEKLADLFEDLLADRQENHIRGKKDDKPEIAFLMENIPFYSGGRYHNYMQSLMLNEAGKDVVMYSNMMPSFYNDFDLCKEMPIEMINSFDDLDVQADMYFGSPVQGSMAALRLGKKYNKPVVITLFDNPILMQKSNVIARRELTSRHEIIKNWLHENLDDLPDFRLVVNTHNAIQDHVDYFEIDPKYVTALHPPLNSPLIKCFDRRPERERRNWIMAVSRNNVRKGWEDVFTAFRDYAEEYELHIITNSSKGLSKTAERCGVPLERIHIHIQISDIEKFKLFSQSKALISGSTFEGFGMWCTEARAFGMPVVCYDLPSLQEVYPEERKYRAGMGNAGQLSQKLGLALKDGLTEPKEDHFFEAQIPELLKIVNFGGDEVEKVETSISALYIVLNEEKFIQASLKSVIKRPEISEVIVVEGADKLYQGASEKGLSVDATASKIQEIFENDPNGHKIKFIQHGWAKNGKAELRQRCIDESSKNGWGLFIDGDEVWSDYYWTRLVAFIKQNKDKGALYFKHLHFWKDKDHVTTGGQWDSNLFRLFRFAEPNLYIDFHGGEPKVAGGMPIGEKYGRARRTDVKVHHYGACKDGKDIKEKLAYYKARDKQLDVRDTWSDWKEGDNDTQWTHKSEATKVESYSGHHPDEIKGIL